MAQLPEHHGNSSLPKDGELSQSVVHDDGDDPDPMPGASGHVPCPKMDRFELCSFSKLTITFLVVGLVFLSAGLPVSVFLSVVLPVDVNGDKEDVSVPGHIPRLWWSRTAHTLCNFSTIKGCPMVLK